MVLMQRYTSIEEEYRGRNGTSITLAQLRKAAYSKFPEGTHFALSSRARRVYPSLSPRSRYVWGIDGSFIPCVRPVRGGITVGCMMIPKWRVPKLRRTVRRFIKLVEERSTGG